MGQNKEAFHAEVVRVRFSPELITRSAIGATVRLPDDASGLCPDRASRVVPELAIDLFADLGPAGTVHILLPRINRLSADRAFLLERDVALIRADLRQILRMEGVA